MSVRQAQREIDSAEFAEWMAFYRLEPWGREVEDRPAALVASTLANIHRGKNRKPYKIDDFALRYDRESAGQTVEQQMQAARRIVAAFGGKVR